MITQIKHPRYKYKLVTWKHEYYCNNLRELLKAEQQYKTLLNKALIFIESYQSNIFLNIKKLKTTNNETNKAIIYFNNCVSHLLINLIQHNEKEYNRILLTCFLSLFEILPKCLISNYKTTLNDLRTPLLINCKHLIKEK